MHSEFIREGFMYSQGNVICLLTQIYTLDKSSGKTTIVDEDTWHVEVSLLIDKGVDLQASGLALVQYAQLLQPYVWNVISRLFW